MRVKVSKRSSPRDTRLHVRRPQREIPETSGRVVCTAAHLRELELTKTELAREHSELLASQAKVDFERRRYEELFNFAPDAYVVTDLAGHIREVNVAAAQLLSKKRALLVGLPLDRFFAKGHREKVHELLNHARAGVIETAGHIEGTLRQPGPNGPVRCSLRINSISEPGGSVVGLRCLIRDVTERKKHEAQQRILLELLQRVNRAGALGEIYEAAVTAVCNCLSVDRASILLFDPDGVMRFKFAHGLSEQYQRAVEGHSPWTPDVIAPEPVCIEDIRLASVDASLRRTIEKEGIRALAFIPLTYEQRLLGKFMIYHAKPHSFSAQELGLAHAIAGPVAFAVERKRGEEALADAKTQLEEHARNLEHAVAERTLKLRESIAELEAFSYSLSHDMRAPLRAMRSFSEILEERFHKQLGAEGSEILGRIISASGRLDRLIQDVLTYSRIALAPASQETIDVEKLVQQIISEHPSFQAPHAIIEIKTPLPPVLGHEASLTQCIYNLLSNAVKFVEIGRQPRVQIWSEVVDGHVKLWFADNGVGIPLEAQARMFLMFQRFHRSRQYEGTGIGLAIVRKAAERLGGQVGVESTEGQGSKFWLQLRLA
jgi:PAS domain S-box-containing protein